MDAYHHNMDVFLLPSLKPAFFTGQPLEPPQRPNNESNLLAEEQSQYLFVF